MPSDSQSLELSVKKVVAIIPHGDYCYSILQEPCAETNYALRVKTCPFWKLLDEHPHQMNGWCDYLKTGDMVEGGTDLLWDQVKECGVNSPDGSIDILPALKGGELCCQSAMPGPGA